MVLLTLLGGCAAPLPDTTPYVTGPRVLAVRAEPPEAEPGATVTFEALYADAAGARAEGAIDWGFCTARKPLAEPGPVASACLDATSEDLAAIGTGLVVAGALPDDACSRFGPNPPPPDEGGVAGRPVDADGSGGYYQPVLAFDEAGAVTLASARVRCGLANASQDDFIAWNLAYRDNVNPVVAGLSLDGVAVPDEGAAVAAGADVAIEVAWPECDTDTACGGAETYVLYADGELADVRETLAVSWFTTGGTFAEARGGRAADDPATTVANTWTAPADAGEVWLAAVLRDDRGGVGFAGWRIAVE